VVMPAAVWCELAVPRWGMVAGGRLWGPRVQAGGAGVKLLAGLCGGEG
jgi:hypothetical protein